MKNHLIVSLGLGLGLALSSSAGADTPINPTTLGSVDSVLKFCRQIYPDAGPGYKAVKVSLFGKQPDITLDALERTADYQQAFAFIRLLLGSTPADEARKQCRNILPAGSVHE